MSVKAVLLALMALTASGCTQLALKAVNNPLVLGGGYTTETRSYGTLASQTLDIYTPANQTHKNEIVMFIYGGRWEEGRKEDYRFVGAYFAQHGYTTVIPDYRKYPDIRFPVFVADVAQAAVWAGQNLRPQQARTGPFIHLIGHSAGAHIGSLIVADERYVSQEGANVRNLFLDFVGLAGPYAFTPDEADLIDMFGPPARYAQMQATSFIDGQEIPMLLAYGGRDDIVKASNHQKLERVIKESHGQVKSRGYPDLDHVGLISTFSKFGAKSTLPADTLEFFNRPE